jgi:hypothetical protein
MTALAIAAYVVANLVAYAGAAIYAQSTMHVPSHRRRGNLLGETALAAWGRRPWRPLRTLPTMLWESFGSDDDFADATFAGPDGALRLRRARAAEYRARWRRASVTACIALVAWLPGTMVYGVASAGGRAIRWMMR